MTDIPDKTFRRFKLACVSQNYTMREAVIWIMGQIGSRRMPLPRKE